MKKIVIIGPSGAGKTSIAKALTSMDGFKRIITDTSRGIMMNEVDGVDYNFVTRKYFKEHMDEYVERTRYADNIYGTRKSAFKSPEGVYPVMIMDINGARKVKKHFGEDSVVVFIKRSYIQMVEAVMDKRMSKEAQSLRLNALEGELEWANDNIVDLIVDNDSTIEDAVKKITNYLIDN